MSATVFALLPGKLAGTLGDEGPAISEAAALVSAASALASSGSAVSAASASEVFRVSRRNFFTRGTTSGEMRAPLRILWPVFRTSIKACFKA